MKSSLEIAQEATLRPIMDIAREIGLEEDEVDLYGKYKAKVNLGALDRMAGGPDAKIMEYVCEENNRDPLAHEASAK